MRDAVCIVGTLFSAGEGCLLPARLLPYLYLPSKPASRPTAGRVEVHSSLPPTLSLLRLPFSHTYVPGGGRGGRERGGIRRGREREIVVRMK